MSSGNCVDYATLTVADSAVGLDSASPTLTAGATVRGALITVEEGPVRWRADGTAPTSAEGHLMNIGDVLNLTDRNYRGFLGNLKFIRSTSTSGKLKITYFGV
jgi:hypothetical protein